MSSISVKRILRDVMNIKKDPLEGVFYAETYPILTNKNVPEVLS